MEIENNVGKAPPEREVRKEKEFSEMKVSVAGFVTYWHLASCYRETLVDHLRPLGLESFVPKPARPKECLRRAMKSVARGREVKSIKGGYRFMRWDSSSEEGDWNRDLKVQIIEENGRRALRFDPPNDPRKALVWEAFKKERKLISSDRLRYQLIKIIEHLNGLTLKEDGAVYFVPAPKREVWRAVARGVKAASAGREIEIYWLSPLLDDDAREATRDALEREIAQTLERWEVEIEDGGLTKRKIKNRKKEMTKLLQRLEEHKSQMGVDTARCEKAISQTRGHLVLAAMHVTK